MLTARRGVGEFLYGGLGRKELTFAGGWVDTTIQMNSGTPLAVDTASGNLVPWDINSAVAGHNACVGLLYEHVDIDPSGATLSWRVSYLANGPQAVSTSYGRVPLLFTNTQAQLVTALKALGLKVMD